MGSDNTINALIKVLDAYDEYGIIYHTNPDGDCIGAAYALALSMQKSGKKCAIYGEDVPDRYADLTSVFKSDVLNDPVYICVDVATPDGLGTNIDKSIKVCIDHHSGNSVLAEYKYVKECSASCCELIYEIIKIKDSEVSQEIANLLALGIITDTKLFRSKETDVNTFKIVSELKGYGADIYLLSNKYMFKKNLNRLMLENELFSRIRLSHNNEVATIYVRQNDISKYELKYDELEGITDLVNQIAGVKIGIVFREQISGGYRCSVVTDNDVKANVICRTFGGGGHEHSACCFFDEEISSGMEKMEHICGMVLDEIEN